MTFYATIDSDSIRTFMPDVPYLLPASSWFRKSLAAPRLPSHITHVAADSGGFVASCIWGEYRYTPEEYVRWLKTFSPVWAATMDYCCEKNTARVRQQQTTQLAHLFWEQYKQTSWTWTPTIQGWEVSNYRDHARELAPLIQAMYRYYGKQSPFRVGIGTLCKRANKELLDQVITVVSSELPNIPLHLWGIKLSQLRYELAQRVVSVDSAAWNNRFGRDIEVSRKSGLSQRQYAYLVALPSYLAKIKKAITKK